MVHPEMVSRFSLVVHPPSSLRFSWGLFLAISCIQARDKLLVKGQGFYRMHHLVCPRVRGFPRDISWGIGSKAIDFYAFS